MSAKIQQFDFLVLGSGIAGLSFALKVADKGKVALMTKREAVESNTRYAQGGIASVSHEDDTFLSHIEDTLKAGAGLCHPDVVEAVVKDGPARIADLLSWGVRFSHRDQKGKQREFDLTREGGHSARRVLHKADFTGQELERALLKRVRAHKNIKIFEWHMAVDLILSGREVLGAHVLDVPKGTVQTFAAKATLLATGGSGKVYLYTTNPDVATGDGVAMAYRAGAKVANLEFFQFHPTCLYHPQAKNFLISEALRGEGGLLKDRRGRAFMARFHPLKELAPRDIVARAIDQVLKESGAECVYLDMTHHQAGWLKKRFPGIYKTCLGFGIDLTRQPIPVVPAAHYQCGGVLTDLDGRTSLGRLYASGETACTGLHGANRLASNSLLEALVFSHRAARHALANLKAVPKLGRVPAWNTGSATDSHEAVVVTQNWEEIRRLMWNYVGIVRSHKRLQRARRRIELLRDEIREYYWDFNVTGDLIELRNIATLAELVVRSALARRESLGLHYNLDSPHWTASRGLHDTVLEKGRSGPKVTLEKIL